MDGIMSNGCGVESSVMRSMENKSILITGATGFLAKVFLEKVLRVQPQVKKLYLLLRAKDNISAIQRFQEQVIAKELFNVLRGKHGEDFENFISNKVVPLAGEISSENLNINDRKLQDEMLEQIDFIVHVAGNTNFDERYDIALTSNTLGAKNIMEFARKCKKLELFVHVSTAYITRQNEGLILETPICNMDGISNSTPLDILQTELKIVEERLQQLRKEKATDKIITLSMKELGLQRAKMHGWCNTYLLTKAMGEMVIGQLKESYDIAVVIVRPSMILSTYKHPFPGWMEGFKTIDVGIYAYGKGQVNRFLADADSKMDVVPVDIVVNVMVVAMSYHHEYQAAAAAAGGGSWHDDMAIYQVCSSSANPISYIQLGDWAYKYFCRNPFYYNTKPIRISKFTFLSTTAKFASHVKLSFLLPLKVFKVVNTLCFNIFKNRYNKLNKKIKRLTRWIELYMPFILFKGRFDNSNMEKLGALLKEEEEKLEFEFNLKCIDWEDYFINAHFPGLSKHVFK